MVEAAAKKPGADIHPDPNGPSLINLTLGYKKEAEDARKRRLELNKINVDAYMGLQDWTHKQDGQSAEFVPKVATSVEQFAALIQRGMTSFGDWFQVEMGRGVQLPIAPEEVRALLMCYFSSIPTGQDEKTIALDTVLSNASKVGLLESTIILKVHGRQVTERRFFVERGEPAFNIETEEFEPPSESLGTQEFSSWRLLVDLIAAEDFYQDPSGAGLYEIHRVEVDWSRAEELAEQGIYDKNALMTLKGVDTHKEHEHKRAETRRGQSENDPPGFRKKIVIDECWGTVLNEDGQAVKKNQRWAIGNDRVVLRKPEDNPFWHQESPFIVHPLINVPFSTWHKAIYDHASPLNLAINEMFNLILDGGLAAVWGIKQLRAFALDDSSDVSGGIPQGSTLVVNETLPANAKVLETVTEGQVPQDALQTLGVLIREFQEAALTNEIALGQVSAKQVKATEIVASQQSRAVTLDGIIGNLETGLIDQLIRKSWMLLMQNADDLDSQMVVDAIGTRSALLLSQMSAPERFAQFASSCSFTARGLSAVLAKSQDFQKSMALLQAVTVNPLLFQAFMKRFSGNKALSTLMKLLNIDPRSLEKDQEEQQTAEADAAEIPGIAQILNGGPGVAGGQEGSPRVSAEDTGDASLPSEINQAGNPLTGLVG
jgi:hypothetical protein